ncbi:unnamed protein product [Dracunculus medinensis]|uniref:Secreted protein n=1 Tax=Dracunculus medinensis TaxID=318479 RepID=A0A0N4UCP4_DRAME|nr:unnamed protein product [Dracunculus medinensis]
MFCRLVVLIALINLSALAIHETVPAVRVVRFQVDYPNASLSNIEKYGNWNSVVRSSILASLRFINKHWLICGGFESDK